MFKWLLGLFSAADKRGKAPPVPAEAPEDLAPTPFLRRESLLDRDQRVAAYQFSVETPAALRGHAWHAATHKFFDAALIDHFAGSQMAGLLGKRLAILPLSPAGLALPRLMDLPRDNLVIEFAPPVQADYDRAEALARLSDLRAAGFRIACGHELERAFPEALALAGLIGLGDVAGQEPPDLLARCRRLAERHPDAQLVARGINTIELYEACRKMGIGLFQGPFLTQRTPSPANRITPYRMFVVKLLNGLRNDADFGDLAAIAWCDPALGYRLLNFVNSAAFGLREKIDRLSNALAYVGRDELKRWLTLLLFSSSEANPLDEALRENALVRAKLAETLAQGRLTRRECDEVFVVGVLSVVDALLEMPMQDALSHLTLPEAVSDALLRHQGKYAPYLKLAVACERSDQAGIRALADELGTDAGSVNRMHVQALGWTMEFIETLS